jgi:membrane-bound ClpP family serine protease
MIVFGLCLLMIAAIVPTLAVLWGIGIIVLVVGVIVLILGRYRPSRRRSTPLLLMRSSLSCSRTDPESLVCVDREM